MRFEAAEFLSRVLVKARKKYLFFGVVIRGIGFGIIWPTVRELAVENPNQLQLPGVEVESK